MHVAESAPGAGSEAARKHWEINSNTGSSSAGKEPLIRTGKHSEIHNSKNTKNPQNTLQTGQPNPHKPASRDRKPAVNAVGAPKLATFNMAGDDNSTKGKARKSKPKKKEAPLKPQPGSPVKSNKSADGSKSSMAGMERPVVKVASTALIPVMESTAGEVVVSSAEGMVTGNGGNETYTFSFTKDTMSIALISCISGLVIGAILTSVICVCCCKCRKKKKREKSIKTEGHGEWIGDHVLSSMGIHA